MCAADSSVHAALLISDAVWLVLRYKAHIKQTVTEARQTRHTAMFPSSEIYTRISTPVSNSNKTLVALPTKPMFKHKASRKRSRLNNASTQCAMEQTVDRQLICVAIEVAMNDKQPFLNC